jgi:flavin-dependent dehydrogenase
VDKGNPTLPEDVDGSAKCCGGLLAPDAQKMLAKMGLGVPQEVLVGPQLFAVRTIDIQNKLERYYQRSYLNIDRGKFDRWLVSLLPDNVRILPRCFFRSLEQDREGVTLHMAQDGKSISERAKVLVGADGAFSLVRKQAFPRRPAPTAYVAIQEWFQTDKPLPYFTAIFDPEITDFYAWIIPKNDSLMVGAALRTGDSATPKFELLKKKLRDRGFTFGPGIERIGTLLLRPVRHADICTGGGSVALIGEAGGWISPSSAEGISYAFRSALALAEAFMPELKNFQDRYRRNTRSLRANIVLKNLKSPFMYNSLLRRLVMSSGLRSIGNTSL